MTRPIVAVAIVLFGAARALGAQALGSITGTVRDTAGVAIVDAEVLLADKRLLTNPQGEFRIDSLPAGTHLLTIRRVGYSAFRSPVIIRSGTAHFNYVLHSAALLLPTVYVEASNAGIYGTVGDSGLKPIRGVRVLVAGRGGGEAITDSGGRFAFPTATDGQFVVRAVHPGYAEARLVVEVKKREGLELALRLRPSREVASRVDEVAVLDLGRRLLANPAGDRLNATQLERYGSLGLCDVNRIAARIKGPRDGLTIIINGTVVLENMSASDLCSWRAGEVLLVEFGDTICRDATRTLSDMIGIWCTTFTKPQDMTAGDRKRLREGLAERRSQRPAGPFVVIWERR